MTELTVVCEENSEARLVSLYYSRSLPIFFLVAILEFM
jgi:hypothetical protein